MYQIRDTNAQTASMAVIASAHQYVAPTVRVRTSSATRALSRAAPPGDDRSSGGDWRVARLGQHRVRDVPGHRRGTGGDQHGPEEPDSASTHIVVGRCQYS